MHSIETKLHLKHFERAAPFPLLALVCLRAWVFMAFTHAHFDSDQAVFGLMAKDIVAGRAYPFFMYGQRYLLAISAWLSACLIGPFGASTFALKLPMLLMNACITLLLWRVFSRDSRIGPWGAFVAILPFALPGIVTASRLVEHAGGNVEPFLFVLLGYFVRSNPVLLGCVFAIGFLNREFTLIGLIALMLMDAGQGRLKERWKAHATTLAVFVSVGAVVRAIGSHAAFAAREYRGPAIKTSFGALRHLRGPRGYFEVQWPTLIGGLPRPLASYNIESALSVGHTWVYLVFWLWLVSLLALRFTRLQRRDLDGAATYLILVGIGQAAAYCVMCPTPFDVMLIRYALLSFYGLVGLIAFAWQEPRARAATLAFTILMSSANLFDHLRLINEYAIRSPKHENEVLADALRQHGIKYGVSDYWVAYDVSWMTDEHVILTPFPDQLLRLQRYRDIVDAHRAEAVTISTSPCPASFRVLKWYVCPAESARQ